MIRVLLIVVCMICLSANSVHARSIPPIDGLEALRKAFSGLSDFTAEITQEKRLSLMKRTMNMTGTIRFRKPDLFYMEVGAPYASRMVLRDGSLEQVIGNSTQPSRIALPPEQGLKRWFSRLSSPITTLPEGMVVTADFTNSVYTVSIAPSGKGQVKDITVVFLEDGTIRKLIIAENNGDRSSMVFKKVRRNVGLTDKDFSIN
jgi:outer membrane lipoprotein carrier protein